MNEANAAMTYGALINPKHISGHRITGLAGIAVRLGRALESWGREVSEPVDRDVQRRDFDRQVGNEARMLQAERLVRHPR